MRVAAHFVDAALRQGGKRYRCAFVTATYAQDGAWHGRHIAALVDRYQKWGRSRGFGVPYVWVAELTKRGRVHYHLMLWLPKGYTPPKPDKQGWWTHGMTNCVWAHSPVGYLAKYASKGASGEFPKGLRMHGRGGLTMAMRARITYALAPTWLKGLVPVEHGVERVSREWVPFGRYGPAGERQAGGRWIGVRGWWRDKVTQMCFRTPFSGQFVPGEGVHLEERPLEMRFIPHDGTPYHTEPHGRPAATPPPEWIAPSAPSRASSADCRVQGSRAQSPHGDAPRPISRQPPGRLPCRVVINPVGVCLCQSCDRVLPYGATCQDVV